MSIEKEKSIVLLQGVMENSLFDLLKKRQLKEIVVLEGRPSLDSAQMSCRALLKRKMGAKVISDNMAGFLFYKNLVKEVWLSYQVAEKSGALCSIGALILAVLGKRHKVAVNLYPAGKKSDFIGRPKDIFYFNGKRIAPRGIQAYVPLMEWVPGKYIGKVYE